MKIIKLQAENIKKIKAIEITPQGNTILITGKNGQGKTSILDAIWYALGGKESIPQKPIRDGESEAQVTLDLGEYIVERRWTSDDTTYLKVMSKDGAVFPSPQKLLDKLIGDFSFDPLGFARAGVKEQVSILLSVVDLNVDVEEISKRFGLKPTCAGDALTILDNIYSQAYDRRTTVNRDVAQCKAQYDGIMIEPGKENVKEVATKELFTKRVELEKVDREIGEKCNKMKELEKNLVYVDKEIVVCNEGFERDRKRVQVTISELNDKIRQLEVSWEKTSEDYKNLVAHSNTRGETIKKELGELQQELSNIPKPDFTEIDKQIAEVDEINRLARLVKSKGEYKKQLDGVVEKAKKEDERINGIRQHRDTLIAQVKMPIGGLGFQNNTVTYKGIPFTQLSSSEQLKISLAIAMALNPQIRVIRITDGSLLDSESMGVIEELAKEKDYQVWIEKVDETGKVGIYIEDGSVVISNK